MKPETNETCEAARKLLVSTDWSLNASGDGTGDAVAVLMSLITATDDAGGSTSLHDAMAVLHVTRTEKPQTFSEVFFTLVLRSASYETWSRTAENAVKGPEPPQRASSQQVSRATFDAHFSASYGLETKPRHVPSSLPSCVGPELSATGRHALANALATLPSAADPTWRRPAFLAAVESLAAMVWACQASAHVARHDGESDATSSVVAAVCPLCAAVAMANELAVEALCVLLVYHCTLSESTVMWTQAQCHLDALLRTAVWNGRSHVGQRLTTVWRQRFGDHSMQDRRQMLRLYCVYVQDEAILAKVSSAGYARSEADTIHSLSALYAVACSPALEAYLAQLCLTMPLMWLSDSGNTEVEAARETTQRTAGAAPTLLAWLVQRGHLTAVHLLLSWLAVAVDPTLRATASGHEHGDDDGKDEHVEAAEEADAESAFVRRPASTAGPLRVDFHQLAATASSSASSPPDGHARVGATHSACTETAAEPVSWSTYTAAAHEVMLLLHRTCVAADASAAEEEVSNSASESLLPCLSPLDLAVRNAQGPLVRLLLAIGASAASVHPTAVEGVLEKASDDNDNDCGFLRLLRSPELYDGDEEAGSAILPQLRSCLYPSSKSAVLASLAAKLWQQKVSSLPLCGGGGSSDIATFAAHTCRQQWQAHLLAQDRVLRPALAALELDPFQPLARLTLIQILSRKLQEVLTLLPSLWQMCAATTAEEAGVAAAARAWLAYGGTVWQLLRTLTDTTVGRHVLSRAVQSHRLLDRYAAQAHEDRVQERLRAMRTEADASTTDSGTRGDETAAASTSEVALFRSATAESLAALRAVASAAKKRDVRVTAGEAPAVATQVLRDDEDGGNGCFVSVHCTASFLASLSPGSGAFLRPHSSARDGFGESADLDAHIWIQIPPVVDLSASLAQTGGCVGVVAHDMPLEAPLEKGDLILFVAREALDGGGSDDGAMQLEAVQCIACHARNHPRVLQVPCVLQRTSNEADDGRVCTLRIVCVTQASPSTSSLLSTGHPCNPLDWLDVRVAAQQQAEAASHNRYCVPVDVLWMIRTTPSLALRWLRATRVDCAAVWAYDIAPLASAEQTTAAARDWMTWDAAHGASEPLLRPTRGLARPLLPSSSDTPAFLYVFEAADDAGESRSESVRVIGVLPESD